MTKISGEYKGNLQCTLVHQPSGTTIFTDAPADIGGKAETFSPTDLVAAALVSCMATTLAVFADRKGWDFTGMRFEVVKEMQPAPERRIYRLPVQVWMPINLSTSDRGLCERVIVTCPVHKSLHPGIEIPLIIHWPSV